MANAASGVYSMKELLGAGLVFIVLSVSLMIGGAMVAKTKNVTIDIANNDSLIYTLAADTGDALSTLTSLLPLLALAVVGGLALYYLISFMGRNTG